MISPFVGRILDWYKAAHPTADYSKEKDPGVESVCAIYKYYKHYNCKTIIMVRILIVLNYYREQALEVLMKF